MAEDEAASAVDEAASAWRRRRRPMARRMEWRGAGVDARVVFGMGQCHGDGACRLADWAVVGPKRGDGGGPLVR